MRYRIGSPAVPPIACVVCRTNNLKGEDKNAAGCASRYSGYFNRALPILSLSHFFAVVSIIAGRVREGRVVDVAQTRSLVSAAAKLRRFAKYHQVVDIDKREDALIAL